MLKRKHINPIIKSKQICILFTLLFFSVSFLFAQQPIGQDNVEWERQDSLKQAQLVQDSMRYQYLILDADAPNYYLDSLKSLVVVSDNDFIGWMNFMDSLAKKSRTFDVEPTIAKVNRPGWVLLVLVTLFIAIGLVRFFFYNNFYNIVNGFYNDRILLQINKEDSLVTSWPYIFLYVIFTCSLGLFITLYRAYILHVGQVEFLTFLEISVVIALLFLIKLIVVQLLGLLFEVGKLVREYIVFLYLFYFNSALILMPLLLFVTFMPPTYFNFVLILFVSVVVILFLFRFLKIFLTLISGLRFSIFYLILYLCTLEIAPILILVKSLNK